MTASKLPDADGRPDGPVGPLRSRVGRGDEVPRPDEKAQQGRREKAAGSVNIAPNALFSEESDLSAVIEDVDRLAGQMTALDKAGDSGPVE